LTCWPNGKVPDYGAFIFEIFGSPHNDDTMMNDETGPFSVSTTVLVVSTTSKY
jgi:hypothetical protein